MFVIRLNMFIGCMLFINTAAMLSMHITPGDIIAIYNKDSMRIVVGPEFITVASYTAREEVAFHYFIGLSYDVSISNAFHFVGTQTIGIFDDLRWSDHPIDHYVQSPLIIGLDLAVHLTFQRTSDIKKIYVGIAYLYPTASEIRDVYAYTSRTFLDCLHLSAGLTPCIFESVETSIGFRYSFKEKWYWTKDEPGYHSISFLFSLAFGI
jgi:hypothetical protein